MRWKRVCNLLLSVIVAASGCAAPVPAPTAPPRDFTTADLLIAPDLLPPAWKASGGPTDYPASPLGFRDNLGGSMIDFRERSGPSDITHLVARFQNIHDAARSFQDHDYTHDTQGTYGTTWHPMAGFTYESPVADQFRVVCGTTRNVPNRGAHCIVEAQYAEFMSIAFYSTADGQRALSDLELVAKAVDAQMQRHLGD